MIPQLRRALDRTACASLALRASRLPRVSFDTP